MPRTFPDEEFYNPKLSGELGKRVLETIKRVCTAY